MWWLMVLYVLPVIITYLFRRKELIKYNRNPNFEDFFEVFSPIINIIIMIRDIIHYNDDSKIINSIIKKVFLIK